MKNVLIICAGLTLLSSCAASKKQKAELANLQSAHEKTLADLNNCDKRTTELQGTIKSKDAELASKVTQLADLQSQVDYLKKTSNNLLDRMSDLSVVSKQGAESIKKSMETLNEQTKYVNNINNQIRSKDSLNLALVMNLKRSLADINDQDVQVEVKKGVVYVSISDKLLFNSGKFDVNPQAEAVLGKVAKVVNDHNELDILVEGHTDAVPFVSGVLRDNWDLSVLRATAVSRVLQSKFGVAPTRLTAGGRGEYAPKDDNATPEGRKTNRRTEIILTPKLDQFFNLLSSGQGK
ncbi:OmpA/MotB family protein [Fibrella aquatica]|uniref:OmpA/MotB family protein n=1 Tax=Fibrella aquatica TaxID=3242487 RepID=UPI00351FB349